MLENGKAAHLALDAKQYPFYSGYPIKILLKSCYADEAVTANVLTFANFSINRDWIMSNETNLPLYHHYLPAFYQASWATNEGKLCRFSNPRPDKLVRNWGFTRSLGRRRFAIHKPHRHASQSTSGREWFYGASRSLASRALTALEGNDPAIAQDP